MVERSYKALCRLYADSVQALCKFFRAHFCSPPHGLGIPSPTLLCSFPLFSIWIVDKKVLGSERSSKMQGRGPSVRAKSLNGQESAWAQKIPSGADPSSAKKRRWQRPDAGTSENLALPIRLFRGA